MAHLRCHTPLPPQTGSITDTMNRSLEQGRKIWDMLNGFRGRKKPTLPVLQQPVYAVFLESSRRLSPPLERSLSSSSIALLYVLDAVIVPARQLPRRVLLQSGRRVSRTLVESQRTAALTAYQDYRLCCTMVHRAYLGSIHCCP
jgi:hypothetical protein